MYEPQSVLDKVMFSPVMDYFMLFCFGLQVLCVLFLVALLVNGIFFPTKGPFAVPEKKENN